MHKKRAHFENIVNIFPKELLNTQVLCKVNGLHEYMMCFYAQVKQTLGKQDGRGSRYILQVAQIRINWYKTRRWSVS